jgi:hypothetical protein
MFPCNLSFSICLSWPRSLAPTLRTLVVADATPAGIGRLRHRRFLLLLRSLTSTSVSRWPWLHAGALDPLCDVAEALCLCHSRRPLTLLACWRALGLASSTGVLSSWLCSCFYPASPSTCACRTAASCNFGVPFNQLTSDAAAVVVMPLCWSTPHPRRR